MMEPPSSPPTLPATAPGDSANYTEFALPQPRSRLRRSHGAPGKKRRRDDSSYTNSSDPPVFSSDAPDASIDDYRVSQRQKRTLIGPWYHHDASIGQKRRQRASKVRRNFDSGVWMENSGSDLSSDTLSLGSDEVLSTNNAVSLLSNHVDASPGIARRKVVVQADEVDEGLCLEAQSSAPVNAAHAKAFQILEACIEEGKPNVDLAELNLEKLYAEEIDLLRLITLQSKKTTQPEPEEYSSLTPDLRLYLASNSLSTIPGELCTLTNLTSLSLRNNKLTSLPAQLGHLASLEDLNVSVNRLRYLPYSFLPRLLKSPKNLRFSYNAFVQPVPSAASVSVDEDLDNNDGDGEQTPPNSLPTTTINSSAHLSAVSSICYFALDGRPLSHSSPPPSSTPESQPTTLTSTARQPHLPSQHSTTSKSSSHAPSLLELALRSSHAEALLQDVHDFGDAWGVPRGVLDLVQRAADVQAAGGAVCDVCGGGYVLPRAEWVEWWAGIEGCGGGVGEGDEGGLVPFLVSVCSWGCVPAGVVSSEDGQGELVRRGCGWKAPGGMVEG